MKLKEFNLFEPILKGAECYNNEYYLLALKGDITKYHYDTVFVKKTRNYYKCGNGIETIILRKTESELSLKADVLIYTKKSESLDWKTLYRNNTGIYFKKENKNIYIIK